MLRVLFGIGAGKLKNRGMKLRSDLILRKMGDEYVIVDPGQEMVDMSKVYTLNSTAAFLWEQLTDQLFTIESVTEVLLEHFDVSEAEARSDAQKLVKEFEEQGLLTD